jgi:hypothetical protein
MDLCLGHRSLGDCSRHHWRLIPQWHRPSHARALEQPFRRERHCQTVSYITISKHFHASWLCVYLIRSCSVHNFVPCLFKRTVIGTSVSLARHGDWYRLQNFATRTLFKSCRIVESWSIVLSWAGAELSRICTLYKLRHVRLSLQSCLKRRYEMKKGWKFPRRMM